MKTIFNIICFAIYVSFLLTPSSSRSEVVPKILILHSYHQGSPWTDHVMEGMLSVLKPTDNGISIHTEYLDAQRSPKEELWPDFENYLKAKYAGDDFDVILASDDDILDFLIPRYKDLFSTTPIIFCGINNLDVNKFKTHKTFKGINQEIDAKRTIEFALKMQPHTEKFLVISDRTSGGIKTTKKFEEDIKDLGLLKPTFQLIDDFTLPELKAHLQALGPKDLVLVLRLQTIKGIDERSSTKFLKVITDTAPVPAFKVWGTGKTDFLGGVYVSSFAQGKTAAEIGLRILRGENPSNIPEVTESPNVPTLNYAILKKFQIDKNNIPEGTKVTNLPISFLEKYRNLAILALGIAVVLVVIIISLVAILFNNRKSRKIISESRQLYQDLYDNAPEMFASVDPKTALIIRCNQTLADKLGYTRDEIINRQIFEVYHPDSRDDVKETFDLFVAKGEIRDRELQLQKKDGDKIEVSLNVSTVIDDKGDILYSRSSWRDITDYKIIVEEKKKLEFELLQSQKMESIGTLAGGIAHDFNNILSSVLGFTELALDAVEKKTAVAEDLQEVYSAGLRAKDLVNQILTFARQSEEKLQLIQIDSIIKEVLKFIRSSIPTSIDIKQDIKSDSLIMASATQIHRIIMNLCTNAAQAMEDEGGTLEITFKDICFSGTSIRQSSVKPGDYVEIKVSDTGCGIEPYIIEKIFDPYFTTKGPGDGTGMGLAMVHGIVETYGGKILVESIPGKGTVFLIYLPIARNSKVHLHYKKEELPIGQERILFVDDEIQIVKMASRILGQLGYSVTTKTNSLEALELFRSKPSDFDLIISDVTMPEMTGDQLTKKVLEIRPDIPVILCTGYSKRLSEQNTSEIGIKALAYKPIVKEDLAKTVRSVLDGANE